MPNEFPSARGEEPRWTVRAIVGKRPVMLAMPEGEEDAGLPRGNRLLDTLPDDDYRRLLKRMELVQGEMKDLLMGAGGPIDWVWFPLSGVVSLLTTLEEGAAVEVATIGNEGFVGVPVLLGATTISGREFYQVQVPGEMLRMSALDFRACADEDPVNGVVFRYAQAFFSQIAQQVACNGLHTVEERASRWMLLTHDRVGADTFPLTQEFLSQMLGVRRASVTVAAGILQNAGFIRYGRGQITIVDREGLENAACECYHIIRAEFDRLLP